MNIYDFLAVRCYVSRAFVKQTILMVCYRGEIDPWVKHLFMTELSSYE